MPSSRGLPQFIAAVTFAVSVASAVLVGEASHAGERASSVFSAMPQAASATVSIGIGFGSSHRFYRYVNRGGVWVRFGYGYAAGPGYLGGYYLGYGPPAFAYGAPFYASSYGRRVYYPAYYGRRFYAPAFYGRARYGGGYYSGGYYSGAYRRGGYYSGVHRGEYYGRH